MGRAKPSPAASRTRRPPPTGKHLFNTPRAERKRLSEVLRRDLAAAREVWLEDAPAACLSGRRPACPVGRAGRPNRERSLTPAPCRRAVIVLRFLGSVLFLIPQLAQMWRFMAHHDELSRTSGPPGSDFGEMEKPAPVLSILNADAGFLAERAGFGGSRCRK